MLTLEQIAQNYETTLAEATRFFMGVADVQSAAHRLAQALEKLGIPYAIAGGLAVAAHGHVRMTADVDVLMTAEGLDAFKQRWLGVGWVERFKGSRGLRDAQLNVKVDVLLAGDYPGDGKPQPVSFPDPAQIDVVVIDHACILPLATLIELKLASGLSAPHRLQDFADVIALIRANTLPQSYGEHLNASVLAKFKELWGYAQISDEER